MVYATIAAARVTMVAAVTMKNFMCDLS